MTALHYVPIVFSLLVLGAHFLRESNDAGVVIALLLIVLLAVRRRWAARIVQAALVLGTIEWLLTIYQLASFRAAHGQPATRMVVILGCVAGLAFVSALLFQSAPLRRVYQRRSGTGPG